MSKTRILFINTEVEPYMPSGHLADLGRMLPQAIQESGHEIRIFMPRFGTINERRNQLHEVIRLSGANLIINEADHPLIIKVASLMPQRIQVYFIDNDDYFTQREVYCNAAGTEYQDQAERCLFFARGVAETVRKLRWTPDVIYCQGWFAAIAPLYLKKAFGEDPCFRNSKIVLGLFNNAYSTPWPTTTSHTLKVDGITKADLADIKDKTLDHTALCKFALKFCDGAVITDQGIDQDLIDAVKHSGKPILDVSDQQDIDAEVYSNYFESFFPKDSENEEE